MKDNTDKKSTRELGAKAEDLATEFLEKKGYTIIKRNFHFGRYGEIDIIVKDGEEIVFVEVKSRSSNQFGSPLDAMTPKKQNFLRRAAEGYYYVNGIENQSSRFDVITIEYKGNDTKIEHYENAF